MDQGIIANRKLHYWPILVKQLISAIYEHEPYAVSVFDAKRLISLASDLIKPSTVVHSFAHCHFNRPGSASDDQEDLSFADLATRLRTAAFEVDGT